MVDVIVKPEVLEKAESSYRIVKLDHSDLEILPFETIKPLTASKFLLELGDFSND